MPRAEEIGEPFSYNPQVQQAYVAQQQQQQAQQATIRLGGGYIPPSPVRRPTQVPTAPTVKEPRGAEYTGGYEKQFVAYGAVPQPQPQAQAQYIVHTRPSPYGARDYTTLIPVLRKPSPAQPLEYTIAAKAFVEKGTKTWRKEEFEKEFGVEIAGLPVGALITGYTEQPYGTYEISYVSPTKVTFPTKDYAGLTVGAAKRLVMEERELASFIAPLLIKAKEEKWPRLSETLAVGSIERGAVSAVESSIELVFPYPTPTPKHHGLGYLVFEAPIPEKAGYIAGELAVSLVVGYALSGPITWGTEQLAKVGGKIAEHVPEGVKEWAKFGGGGKAWERVSGAVKEVTPSLRGSRVDVWLAKHSGIYYRVTGGVAKGEIALGEFEVYGLPELEAEAAAWSILGSAPRLGGVYVARGVGGGFAGAKALPHLIYHGGKISVGYLRELSYAPPSEAQLTPLVSQQQLTRMGVQPYFPKVSATFTRETGKLLMPTLVAAGAIGMARLAEPKQLKQLKTKVATVPKISLEPVLEEPTLALQRIAYSPVAGIEQPQRLKPKVAILPKVTLKPIAVESMLAFQRVKYTPLEEFAPRLKERGKIAFVPTLTHAQAVGLKQLTTQITVPAIPTPTIPTFTVPKAAGFGYWPRGGGWDQLKGVGAFRGKWFKRTHPIKTYQEMMRTFGFRVPIQKKRRKR